MRDPLAKDFNLSEEQVFAGHANSIFRALFSPDGSQVVTVSTDNTARWWDVNANAELFTIRLPAYREDNQPTLWDFDFRCLTNGECWLGIPLTQGKLLTLTFSVEIDLTLIEGVGVILVRENFMKYGNFSTQCAHF